MVAGVWSRAFAAARVEPAGAVAHVIEPHLGEIGRQLMIEGEAVFAVEGDGAGVELRAAHGITVTGGPDPRGWVYLLTLPGPLTHGDPLPPADAVLHLRAAWAPSRPWEGITPLAAAATTRHGLRGFETRLSDEAWEAVGNLFAVPDPAGQEALQRDLRGLRGKILLVQTVLGGWGQGRSAQPQRDWAPQRVGSNPPGGVLEARRDVERSLLAACGIPPTLLASGGDGALARESFRQFLHGSVQPVGRIIAGPALRLLRAAPRVQLRRPRRRRPAGPRPRLRVDGARRHGRRGRGGRRRPPRDGEAARCQRIGPSTASSTPSPQRPGPSPSSSTSSHRLHCAAASRQVGST